MYSLVGIPFSLSSIKGSKGSLFPVKNIYLLMLLLPLFSYAYNEDGISTGADFL
jgi:hypothetical protein